MKMVGNEIYIQRGETWSLDFAVRSEKGHPLMLFKGWKNPYLVITVTNSAYPQNGIFKMTYWLDLDKHYEEQNDGSLKEVPVKRFIATEPLYVETFDESQILSLYTKIKNDAQSDFDITNYLFYTEIDGENIYRYVERDKGVFVWIDYDFRIVKHFTTKDWLEQKYLYDIKLLAGDAIEGSDVPLAADYEVNITILEPTNLFVGVNLQGG